MKTFEIHPYSGMVNRNVGVLWVIINTCINLYLLLRESISLNRWVEMVFTFRKKNILKNRFVSEYYRHYRHYLFVTPIKNKVSGRTLRSYY